MLRRLSSAALYGSTNTLQLPFSGLSEVCSESDKRVHAVQRLQGPQGGIEVRMGRKWSAAREFQVADAHLRQKTFIGMVERGQSGLGFLPSIQVDTAKGKERQHLLQEEVRAGVEEVRASKMLGLRQQGAWTRGENTQWRKITWPELWQADSYCISILVQVVYDTLPSPANLHTGCKSDTPAYPLCAGRGSLQHLLNSYPKALADWHYRWRHV